MSVAENKHPNLMPPQLHEYGMRLRPFGIGCQPPGHYAYRDTNKAETGFYGILTYARMLKKEELEQYELTYIDY